jgi:D-arabinose 1-dehydrogenase-like Zn-dependent alcohol dehydrogenase
MGFDAKPLSISPMDLISKRIRVIGSQQNHREFLFEAQDLAARGKVKVMTEVYPLAEVGRAWDRVEQGKVRFRALITP